MSGSNLLSLLMLCALLALPFLLAIALVQFLASLLALAA
jgi:hypothetical protein